MADTTLRKGDRLICQDIPLGTVNNVLDGMDATCLKRLLHHAVQTLITSNVDQSLGWFDGPYLGIEPLFAQDQESMKIPARHVAALAWAAAGKVVLVHRPENDSPIYSFHVQSSGTCLSILKRLRPKVSYALPCHPFDAISENENIKVEDDRVTISKAPMVRREFIPNLLRIGVAKILIDKMIDGRQAASLDDKHSLLAHLLLTRTNHSEVRSYTRESVKALGWTWITGAGWDTDYEGTRLLLLEQDNGVLWARTLRYEDGHYLLAFDPVNRNIYGVEMRGNEWTEVVQALESNPKALLELSPRICPANGNFSGSNGRLCTGDAKGLVEQWFLNGDLESLTEYIEMSALVTSGEPHRSMEEQEQLREWLLAEPTEDDDGEETEETEDEE